MQAALRTDAPPLGMRRPVVRGKGRAAVDNSSKGIPCHEVPWVWRSQPGTVSRGTLGGQNAVQRGTFGWGKLPKIPCNEVLI